MYPAVWGIIGRRMIQNLDFLMNWEDYSTLNNHSYYVSKHSTVLYSI
jgi:hypothetical protein